MKSIVKIVIGLVLFTVCTVETFHWIGAQQASAQTLADAASTRGFDTAGPNDAGRMLAEGQKTFRFDTFGDEEF